MQVSAASKPFPTVRPRSPAPGPRLRALPPIKPGTAVDAVEGDGPPRSLPRSPNDHRTGEYAFRIDPQDPLVPRSCFGEFQGLIAAPRHRGQRRASRHLQMIAPRTDSGRVARPARRARVDRWRWPPSTLSDCGCRAGSGQAGRGCGGAARWQLRRGRRIPRTRTLRWSIPCPAGRGPGFVVATYELDW